MLQTPNRYLVLAKGDVVNTRTETYLGREWTVVPVVALVEGVIHAMNAKNAEFVPEDAYNDMTSLSWNGRPVFIGHPVDDQGRPVSGNTPEVLEALSFGQVFNVGFTDGKLTMEAWLDNERASAVPDGEALLARIAEGKPIEISIGAFIEIDESAIGSFNGTKYQGKWITIAPDHLALLPEGDEGACSRKMGCGVRTARGAEIMAALSNDEFQTLRNIPQSERDKMPAEDFAGPNRSFPIAEPEDVAAAASSLGRAKGNKDAIKKKIIVIAYRKGDDFVAKLPETWKKKKDQRSAIGVLLGRVMSAFRAEQNPDEMSDADISRKLTQAIRAKDPRAYYPVAVYDRAEPYSCVYEVYSDGTSRYYSREFSMDAAGTITLGDPTEVEPILTYEAVGAMDNTDPLTTAAAALAAAVVTERKACGCGGQEPAPAALSQEQETNMQKAERIKVLSAKLTSGGFAGLADPKFLETASDAQLDNLEKLAGEGAPAASTTAAPAAAAPAAVATPAAVPAVAAPAVAAAPKAPTADEFVASAPSEIGDVLRDAMAQAKGRKDATIKVLVGSGRCDLNEATLGAKSQSELDSLVKLAGLAAIPAQVDYSAKGVSRAANTTESQVVPAAPDLTTAIRASRGQK